MPSRPDALVVDYGGVLTTNVFASFRAFCEVEGLAPDALVHLFLEDEDALAELHRLECGTLAEDDFEQALARRLGVGSSDGLVARLFAQAVPDRTMWAAVRAVRALGVRTCLLSNSWTRSLYPLRELAALFDALVLSCDVGLRKPDRGIFLLAARRVDAQPASCVFVDDLRSNCAAARDAGMIAVLHRDAEKTVAELERLFGMRLERR